jgi:transposase
MATSQTTLTAAEQLVPDEVWTAVQPLLPAKRPHPKGGRPWIQDRAVLGGIIYVLRAGVPWRLLRARELGCGSRVTCWRRLRDWQQAGVWQALHHRLLDWLGDDGQVDWSRAAIDSVSVRARRGGADRRESGRPRQASRHRWKVERSMAWLLANRRLTVRYERRADILTALLHLACALICARKLQPL